jgi:hypothetical protein
MKYAGGMSAGENRGVKKLLLKTLDAGFCRHYQSEAVLVYVCSLWLRPE